MSVLTMCRPALITSDTSRLDEEFKAARRLYHRLLDFEDAHQRVLDAAAEAAAPGIVRIGRILSRLARRAWRRSRTPVEKWSPNPHPELAENLKARMEVLRAVRNADAGWVVAKGWADEEIGELKKVRRRRAKDPSKIKRRKTESLEAFEKRFALFTVDETDEHFAKKKEKGPRQTRREVYRAGLYEKERTVYWGTWNALCKSVDQSRKAVLKRRALGLPAEWRRPRWRDPTTIATDKGGIRILSREGLWWTVAIRLGLEEGKAAEWVTMRVKGGSWHSTENAKIRTAKLTRRIDGNRWSYSLSVSMEGVQKRAAKCATSGLVAFDWGHREHGHDTAADGLRAFVWRGDDGREGEVLVPAECRRAMDEIDVLKARMDKAFDARKAARDLPDRNRHAYRRRLGVCTEEENAWLKWEMRYERRIAARRKRFQNLRRETYTLAIKELRKHYALFAFEAERIHDAKKPRSERGQTIRELQTDDEMVRRKRANRDLTARYEFVTLCERFGAELVPVPSRNTTRECPTCGQLGENGPELLTACLGCGTVRDKDRGAAIVILRRAQEALANEAAE